MSMTLAGVLFVVSLFSCLALLSYLTRKKVIDPVLQQGRAHRSPVTEFVDDLLRYRWVVIIGLAVLVALDRSLGFSGGLLQSRLALAVLITLIFVGRLLARPRPGA
jgi:hypothetical protein